MQHTRNVQIWCKNNNEFTKDSISSVKINTVLSLTTEKHPYKREFITTSDTYKNERLSLVNYAPFNIGVISISYVHKIRGISSTELRVTLVYNTKCLK